MHEWKSLQTRKSLPLSSVQLPCELHPTDVIAALVLSKSNGEVGSTLLHARNQVPCIATGSAQCSASPVRCQSLPLDPWKHMDVIYKRVAADES